MIQLPNFEDRRPIPESNFDGARPGGVLGVVEHTTVGTLEQAEMRFKSPTSIVSANFGVGLSGRIWCWVDAEAIAYHAGNWPINVARVGIENEDAGRYWDADRTPELYLASGALLAALGGYGFAVDAAHVGAHRDFAATACPDALDVARIIAIAEGELTMWTEEQQQAYMADVANAFASVKALLNPLAAWADGAPRTPKGFELKRHLRVLELAAQPPKKIARKVRRNKKPADAPSRSEVLAGHGKGNE